MGREDSLTSVHSVACTVMPEDDLLIGHIEGDFSGISHLDLLWQIEGESERRIKDVPVNPTAGELLLAQAMPAIPLMCPVRARLLLLAQEPAGERLVGEYTFDHTPFRR